MDLSQLSFDDVLVTRVSDGNYFPVALEAIRDARRQIRVSMFIVDFALAFDPHARVDQLLLELSAAQWRGVDVKLLLGGSRTNRSIRDAVLGAFSRAAKLGLEPRLVAGSADNPNSHVKLVIADDRVLAGSHNWSRGMFGLEIQDSVLLDDSRVAAALCTYFNNQWSTTSEVSDVPV